MLSARLHTQTEGTWTATIPVVWREFAHLFCPPPRSREDHVSRWATS